jgi:thioredoxin 1
MVELTEENFHNFVKENEVAFIDFYASWCGPCRSMMPSVDALANELSGRVSFAKVDIDQSPKLANEFSIMSIPTIIIFRNGVQEEKLVGAQTKQELAEKLRPFV